MILIRAFVFRGVQLYPLYSFRYERRARRTGKFIRRMLLCPTGGCTLHGDYTAEEVGQLMGGN